MEIPRCLDYLDLIFVPEQAPNQARLKSQGLNWSGETALNLLI
jgi:hypothetical protein